MCDCCKHEFQTDPEDPGRITEEVYTCMNCLALVCEDCVRMDEAGREICLNCLLRGDE